MRQTVELIFKLFYDATMQLSGTLFVTSNMYIQMHLQAYSENNDYVLRAVAMKLKMKYIKYWENLDAVNKMLFVALIVDPRTKLGFWFKDVLNAEQSTNMTIKLRNNLNKLYDHYNIKESSSQVKMVVNCYKVPQ
jgi:hypothetical protein